MLFAALVLSLSVAEALRHGRFTMTSTAQPTGTEKLNPRDERRRLMRSPNYNRMGFKEEKLGVEELMSSEFTSPLVRELRENQGVLTRGDITIRLGNRGQPSLC